MEKNVGFNYGVQIILSTIPNGHGADFVEDIEQNYYNSYKKAIKSDDKFLYKPLKYFMLGDYDICCITLINNFKFAHRLFEPKSEEREEAYSTHTFQSFSGFALNGKEELEDTFENIPQEYFTAVINLKLNNGLLIGNGLSYIKAVQKFIESELKDHKYILTHTFSWFELSLVVFINNPALLSEILYKLRHAQFSDLNDDELLANSLYNAILDDPEKDKIIHTSLFADTNTNFGFHENLITKKIDDLYVKEFLNFVKENNIKLKTDIEWQIKPGHIELLENEILEHEYLGDFFKSAAKKMVLGKCDYMIQENEEKIESNLHLIRDIYRNENCGLFKHARKVRTYIFLDTIAAQSTKKVNLKPILWSQILKKLSKDSTVFNNTDRYLKSLKVSRQLRIKVLKILSNYNNGIQDPILFPYFLDFSIFIDNMISMIKFEYDKSKKCFFRIQDLESKLNEHVKVFQEGYNVRFLNGYQFENISDFDLDFNSSIQQLLSSYGTLVHEYGKLFFNGQNDSPEYAPIIQLNNIDTVSNYLAINYSVQHLTSPEFVFSTLTKEILNHIKLDSEDLIKLLAGYQKILKPLMQKVNESYFDEMIISEMIDINYFIIDAIRFKVTFDGNFDLFQHWFWSYNFQNSSLYDSSGMFNEEQLRMEIFRIMMIAKLKQIPSHLITCPIPEIFNYWDRHFDKIDKITTKITSQIGNAKLNTLDKIRGFIESINANTADESKENLPIKEMQDLIYKNLLRHFDYNSRRITLLKRSWDTGMPLENFNQLYNDQMYSIDQTGGVYIYNKEKMQVYFKNNSDCLLQIIDFSYRHKKDFIITRMKLNE